jgi:hypothetical protein
MPRVLSQIQRCVLLTSTSVPASDWGPISHAWVSGITTTLTVLTSISRVHFGSFITSKNALPQFKPRVVRDPEETEVEVADPEETEVEVADPEETEVEVADPEETEVEVDPEEVEVEVRGRVE